MKSLLVFTFFALLFLAGAVLCVESAFAEEGKISPRAAGAPKKAEDAKPEIEPLPQAPDPSEMLEPLGVWGPPEKVEELEEEKEQREVKSGISGKAVRVKKQYYFDIAEDEPEEVEVEDEGEEGMKLMEGQEKIRLSQKQLRRLDKIKHMMRQRILKFRHQIRQGYRVDPRGEPELRVCGLSANGYGTPEAIKSAMGRKAAKTFKRKERSLISAIIAADCDVLALMGLIGRDKEVATAGITRIVSKLSKKTEQNWQGYVSDSEHRFLRAAFLVRGDDIILISSKSYTDTLLPRVGELERRKFPIPPFEVTLNIPGKGEAEAKNLTLMTLLFRKKISTQQDPELELMQLAEASRQLALLVQQGADTDNPPIYMQLLDRTGGRYTPSSRVIEGGLRLREFHTKKGKCELTEERAYECSEPLKYPRVLYGLLGNNFENERKIIKRLVPKDEEEESEEKVEKFVYVKQNVKQLRAERVEKNSRTTEIYMMPFDLPYVYLEPRSAAKYNVGVEEIKNGEKNSPLVWTELNW